MSEKHLSNQRFTDFELDPSIVQGIEEAGFEYCTPIQAESLPHLLAGRDVAGQAKTGTGKTAAFLVALFQHLLTHPAPASRTDTQPRALVLAPTRELAIQIDKDARLLGKYLDMRLRLVYGGTGYESQRRDLQAGVDVLIGTPGRIIDYLKQGIYSFDALQAVVLDEADRMFDLGFIKDIRYLFRKMPAPTERLNMLFSATLSLRVNELAYEHMNSPEKVTIESDKITVDQVTQKVYYPSNEDKLPLLLGFLKRAGDTRTLVFMNTKHQSERVVAKLEHSGLRAGVLSGDVPQKQRERLLERFKAGEVNVLVATDVAARGLHIPDVSLVVNYDLPQDPEDYVHRIGRTARAGAAGDAISFACETYAFSLPDIEAFIGQKIEPVSYDQDMLVQPTPGAPSPARGRRGERRDAGGRDKSGRGRKSRGRPDKADRVTDRQQARRQAGKPEGDEAGPRAASGKPADDKAESRAASGERVEDQPESRTAPGKPAEEQPESRTASGKPAEDQPDSPTAPGKPAEDQPDSPTASGKPTEDQAESRAASGQPADDQPESRQPAGEPASDQGDRKKPAKREPRPARGSRRARDDRDDQSGEQSEADNGQNKPGRKPQRRSHEIPAVG